MTIYIAFPVNEVKLILKFQFRHWCLIDKLHLSDFKTENLMWEESIK